MNTAGHHPADCVFCRIVSGAIPAEKIYEDAHCLALRDLHPQAPQHLLIIPKQHAGGLNDLAGLEDAALAACLRAAQKAAALAGIEQSGYRLIANCGPHACQSVGHLHFHLLGGAQLPEKMA